MSNVAWRLHVPCLARPSSGLCDESRWLPRDVHPVVSIFSEGKAIVKSCRKLALIAIVVAAVASSALGRAQAETAVDRAGPGATASQEPVSDTPTRESPSSADPNPMDTFSISIKFGEAGNGVARLSRNVKTGSFPGAIDSRRGFRVALSLHLGGAGFGWTIEPYLSRSSVRSQVKDLEGSVTAFDSVDLTAYGMYTGPLVEIHVSRATYVGLGFGVMTTYIASDGFALGVDLYGRVPLSFTHYVSSQFALVLELGIGYGMTTFANKPREVTDPTRSNATTTVRDRADFGQAFAWDWSFGVRLP